MKESPSPADTHKWDQLGAEVRQNAALTRVYYDSMKAEGFTHNEAFQCVLVMERERWKGLFDPGGKRKD